MLYISPHSVIHPIYPIPNPTCSKTTLHPSTSEMAFFWPCAPNVIPQSQILSLDRCGGLKSGRAWGDAWDSELRPKSRSQGHLQGKSPGARQLLFQATISRLQFVTIWTGQEIRACITQRVPHLILSLRLIRCATIWGNLTTSIQILPVLWCIYNQALSLLYYLKQATCPINC